MKKEIVGIRGLSIAAAGIAVAVPSLAVAQQATPYTIRVSGGLEASSNPFLLEQDAGAVSAFIAVDPTIFVEEGRNTTVIDGSLRAAQYSNDYGTDASGSLRISTQRALTERTELGLSASINSTRRSFLDGLANGARAGLPADPAALPDAVSIDPTLVGALVRSTTISAIGSIEHQLTPVSSLTASAAYSRQQFSNDAGFGVRSASGSISYGRKIAPRTVVSLGGQFASNNFDGPQGGDANVYKLQTKAEHEIGTRWSVAFGAGVDLVDRNLGLAGRETSTLLSGDLSLCNKGLRSRLCVTGRRAAQPTALGGVSTVVSVGVSYELELSENDLMTFNSQYGRSNLGQDTGSAAAGTVVDVIGATANYRHDLSDRTALFVTAGYSEVSDDLRDVSPNAFVRVGVTLSFGRLR